MTERISEEKLSEIRQAVDVVDFIGEYVQLKKQGRNYFGLCPFHGENTPSFSVSPEKQIYYCFGCGAGGNVFSFLMELEGVSFIEAVQTVANKGNVTLQIADSSSHHHHSEMNTNKKMVEAHELLRRFYHHILIHTKEGQRALDYLKQRGFTKDALEKFQIGYALDSWDIDKKFLKNRGFSLELMENAGLIIKRENETSFFDRFRDRIIFPIFDHKGNTVAFSGRSLGSEQPKYQWG